MCNCLGGKTVSEMCFEDFDYDRVRCPSCGEEFDESEIEGMGNCPDCGEPLS